MKNNKTSWDDVTIAMWQELNSIETQSEITRQIEQISILTDTDSEEIRSMPMNKFNELRNELVFLSQKPTANVTTTFEIEGKEFGIIPQLDFISTGEWMDAENWKENPVDNIHLYAALVYRPITKKDGDVYEIEPHKSAGFMERAELFKNTLSITTIHGAVLFFSSFVIGFMPILEDYFNQDTTVQN